MKANKIIATLIAVVMIVACMSVAAFADSVPDAENNVVTLTNDLNDIGEYNLPAGYTLQGNGYTISGKSSIRMGAGSTINNVKFSNITDGKTKTSYNQRGGMLSAIYGSGSATITNCEFDNVSWDAIQLTPVANSVISITGNTFKDTDDVGTLRYVHVQSAQNVDFTITVTGNKFYDGSKIDQTGLEVYYPTDPSKVILSGNYMAEPIAVCIGTGGTSYNNAADKAFPFKNEALTEDVPVVASITDPERGTLLYTSLAQAVEAVPNTNTETTIKLIGNETSITGSGVKVQEGQNIVFDLNGKTYNVIDPTVGSAGTETNAFQLLKGSTVTFKNGELESEVAKIFLQNYCNLTLDNVIVNKNKAPQMQYAVSNNFGSLTVKNNTEIYGSENQAAFDLWYGMSSVYDDGVTVTFDETFNGTVDGKVEYGHHSRVTATDWQEKTALNFVGGGTYNITFVATSTGALDGANITKYADATITAPAGYKWDATGKLVAAEYVAQIGETKYETLEAAFAAAVDGDTITVLVDCTGNGIIAPQGKFANGLTVDFGGKTYTVNANTVGSSGTETNGFQLLKNNKITFKNGTITSEKAKILVQNYSNLTLENMTLTLNNADYQYAYTLSNNNGNVVIDGTTINANPAGVFAFDVCRYSSYSSVDVSVTGNSVINGDIEISASGNDPKDGFGLHLMSGTITGNIVIDESAKTAMRTNSKRINKGESVTVNAPEGYAWVDNELTATCDHTGNHSEPVYFWKVINGKYYAYATYTCETCGLTVTTPDVEAVDNGNEYKATITINNDDYITTKIVASYNYTVTYNGTGGIVGGNTFKWGEICTISADKNSAWYVDEVKDDNKVADGTDKYVFAVTGDIIIISTETEATANEVAAVRATLTSDVANKAVFNAKWSLPTGAQIDKITVYRGSTSTDKPISADTLYSKGAKHNVSLNVRNGDYTLNLEGLTAGKWQHTVIEIKYRVPGDSTVHTLESTVKKVQIANT